MDVKTSTKPPAIWLLVLITFSGTLAMHMFVPVLPEVARDLQTSMAGAQMTLSLYIFGLAVGQLFCGPISDRWGRRPTLVAGLLLYTVAGAVAAITPNISELLAARLVQALGGCVGLVLGRAMVRDTTTPDASMQRLALVNLVLTVGPGLSPILGGALSVSFGWRSIFIALALLGVLNIVLTLTMLPETGKAIARDARSLVHDYKKLLMSKAFAGLAIGGGCSTTSIYSFIAAAPFIYGNQFHRPSHEIGIYIGLMLIGAAIGSVLASRLAGKVSIERMMTGGNMLSLIGAVALLVSVLLGSASTSSTVLFSSLFGMGCGVASPAALTKTISLNPRVIGSAAGLYGFIQMTIGAICTALVGLGPDPMAAAAILMTATTMIGQLGFFIAARQPPLV